MCVGYPNLCCDSGGCGPSGNAPLSPVPDANGKNVSLDAIQAVLGEIAAVSTDEFFHLGGDEVDQSCWTNTPAVQAWMKNNGITTTDGVYEYFVAAVDQMTINLNKSPIRWEEVWKHFGTDLDQRTVIHAWLSSAALIDATSKGYRAIWSVDGLYYLDALGETWDKFYDVRRLPPCDARRKPSIHNLAMLTSPFHLRISRPPSRCRSTSSPASPTRVPSRSSSAARRRCGARLRM